ncbi:MAG: hypothetical protein M1499_01885 [Firmicutes bacterium]|nr:hypothetical protein [Bacillota bacterium]
MSSTQNRNDLLVKHYLDNLRRTLRDVPPVRRDPIIEDVTEQIQTARANMTEETEAGIRRLLDQVGDPETIRTEDGLPPSAGSRVDGWVPWLLLFGGFVFFVGWIIGLVLLWQSSLWRTTDKILGTLLWPVLFAGSIYFAGLALMGPPVSVIIPILGLVVVIGGPILGTFRLVSVYHQATEGSGNDL